MLAHAWSVSVVWCASALTEATAAVSSALTDAAAAVSARQTAVAHGTRRRLAEFDYTYAIVLARLSGQLLMKTENEAQLFAAVDHWIQERRCGLG